MRTTAIVALTAVATFIAFPMSTQTFTYKQDNGTVLTIDPANQSGSIIGPGRDIHFTSPEFSDFEGGDNPSGVYNITIDPSSTVASGFELGTGRPINANGTSFSPIRVYAEQLKFEGNGRYSLCSVWESPSGTRLGDEFFTYTSYASDTLFGSSTSTSTGGSSGGALTPGATSQPSTVG